MGDDLNLISAVAVSEFAIVNSDASAPDEIVTAVSYTHLTLPTKRIV